MDYTKIDNPYDDFLSRKEDLPAPNVSPGVVNENTEFDNIRIGSSIKSKNYAPGSRGFNIDGATGGAEFNNVAVTGTISGGAIAIPNQEGPLFSVDSDGNASVKSLLRRDFQWFTFLDSIDGFYQDITGTGSITIDGGGVSCSTGTSATSSSGISKGVSGASVFSWDKKRRIKFLVSFAEVNSNNSAYLSTGYVSALQTTQRHFGFYLATNGALKAHNADGTTEKETDLSTSLSAGTKYILEAVWDGSTSIKYYVNDVLKATVTQNLPSGTQDALWIVSALVITAAAADKKMVLNFIDFWQEG